MLKRQQSRSRRGMVLAIVGVQAVVMAVGGYLTFRETRRGLAGEVEERLLRDNAETARLLAQGIAAAVGDASPGDPAWLEAQSIVERQSFAAHGAAYVVDGSGFVVAHPRLREDETLGKQRIGARRIRIAGTDTEVPIIGMSTAEAVVGTMAFADGTHYIATHAIKGSPMRVVVDQPQWGLLPLRRGAEARLAFTAAAVGLGVLGLTALVSFRVMRRYESILEAINTNLEIEIEQRLGQLLATRHALIFGLAKLADYRDTDTGAHLERICSYSVLLAEQVRGTYREISDEWIEHLRLAASLHDIGKVGIPDAVLLKPARLTHEERLVIEQHPLIGAETLMAIRGKLADDSLIDMGIDVALQHHEKWDGTGYPHGRRGVEIALSARIVALADFYDAVTSKRVYKEAMSHEEARDLILKNSGTHFDPAVTAAFDRVHEQFRDLRRRLGAGGDSMGIARRIAA